MIHNFLDHLAMVVLGIAALVTAGFWLLFTVLGIGVFFIDLYQEGSPLKAWTVGLSILVLIVAGVLTWYFP